MKEALQHTIKAFIRKGEKYYIAECLEISVITQGKTLDEAVANLREAVALHLEGEDTEQFGACAEADLDNYYGDGAISKCRLS